jgi:hypothetical protein
MMGPEAYADKNDPDKQFWDWTEKVKNLMELQLPQEIQGKTTQIIQQNQQIIGLLIQIVNNQR